MDATLPRRARLRAGLATPAGQRIGLAVLLVLLLVFPLLDGGQGDIDTAANAAAYAALALGLNIVVGMAGLLDLGYAAFFAIGAYFYGILSSFQLAPPWSPAWEPLAWLDLVQRLPQSGGADVVHFTLSFWLALPLGAAFASLCGIAFGAPTLRLKGDYLAIVTLGFGEIVPIVVRNVPFVTAGAAGLNGVAAPHIFGYSFGIDATPYYYTGLALVALLVFVSLRLRDGRVGRAWLAIREDETAASAMGVNLVRLKLLAFAIGAIFASLAGTFYISKLQTATPEMFGFPVSVQILVMIVLGGLGSVWGAVLGAVLIELTQAWLLPNLTSWIHAAGDATGVALLNRIDLVQSSQLIFGLILVLMMLYRREGLIPATRRQSALTFEQQHAEVTRAPTAAAEIVAHGAARPAAALEIRGVTVRFGGLSALSELSLTVPAGGIVAVIGPNGSGKSTLFNVITGLVRAESGSITLGGTELLGLRPHQILRHGLARTFQNIRLFPHLTVLQNVLVGQHARLGAGPLGTVLRLPRVRREEAQARARALEIIAMFGNRLMPRLDQTVSHLSYANRRRVEIARALASGPRLLLLDEPTAGMNPAETMELAEQIRELHAAGLTILLIEHKLDLVTRLADNVIVLDHGVKLTEGLPGVVRRDARVLEAYLGRGAAAEVVAEALDA